MRDTKFSKGYFDDLIEFYLQSIPKFQNALKKQTPGIDNEAIGYYAIFEKHTRILFLKYSRGDDFTEIHSWYKKTIDAWENMRTYIRANLNEEDRRQYTALDFDNYNVFIWLLSFAVNLKVDQTLLMQVVKLINNVGKDALLDRILVKLGVMETATSELFHPRPYKTLYEALDATPDKQPKLVARFLKNWYGGCKQAFWYNNGKDDDSGYFGYWCFEAALVVKLWNIDDQSFAQHPNYPKDLVHWKR